MTDTTPRAGAPLLAAAQAQKHVTHNEALYQFDALLCTRFLDRDLATPPAVPSDGDAYLVRATGTGAWTGQDGKIAYCADGAWRFYAPFAGLVAYVADEAALIVFDGSNWTDYGSLISLQNVPQIGVNAAADSTNRLSVKSNDALLAAVPTAEGGSGDMRVVVSKEAAANTVSLLFRNAVSGRAEIGLIGDDDFHFKVSSDGSTWTDALSFNASSGAAYLPAGQLSFPATPNPSADVNTLDDYQEGTFTPTIYGETTAGVNSYISQVGTYTKIGNRVFFELYVRLNALDTILSGNVAVGGLPFASAAIANNHVACSIYVAGCTLPSACTQFSARVVPNGDYVEIFCFGSNTSAHLTQVNLTSGSQFAIGGSYHV